MSSLAAPQPHSDASITPTSGAPASGVRAQQAEVLSLLTQISTDEASLSAAERALRRILEYRHVSTRTLTSADALALQRFGITSEALERFPDFSASLAGEHQETEGWRQALSASKVSAMLGVTATRVRQRAADGSLYAKRLSSGWQFPAMQFPGGRELDGWPTVARAIPRAAPLVAVDIALHRPAIQLEYAGAARSPLDWLASGGDPELAAQALHDALTRLP